MEIEELRKKQIQMNWDYAKQQNDIRLRIYLQSFVLSLTIWLSITIVAIAENLNILFFVLAFVFFGLAIYFIYRLRGISDDLKEDWKNTQHDFNELLKLIIDER